MTGDLQLKLNERSHYVHLQTYKNMVEVAVSNGRISEDERHTLKHFKERHGIKEGEHQDILENEEWEQFEFEKGIRRTDRGVWRRVKDWGWYVTSKGKDAKYHAPTVE